MTKTTPPPVARSEENSVPTGYDINRLLNCTGATKRVTLNELESSARMTKQGLKPNVSTTTAEEVVKVILNRAGLVDSPQKDDLEKFFTFALNKFVKDPVKWQNPQRGME
jgi:hypothetical protein